MMRELTVALCLAVAMGRGVAVAAGEPPVQSEPGHPAASPADPVADAAKTAFEARLAEIDVRAGETKSLRGRFVQKKHTPLLKKPMESSGKIAIKGDRTRWETIEPRKSVMTIDDKALRIYFPEQKVVEVYDLGDDVREFAGSPLPRLGSLRASFDISRVNASLLGGKDDDAGLLAIELLPKTDGLKKHVARIRVLIDTRLPAARRMEIEDVDGERTEIEFKDIEINTPLRDAEVAMDVPSGTREVHPLGTAKPVAPEPKDAGK